MVATWRALTRRMLTPNTKETKLSTRGFYEKSPEARAQLEHVGETFLAGHALAAGARSVREAEETDGAAHARRDVRRRDQLTMTRRSPKTRGSHFYRASQPNT